MILPFHSIIPHLRKSIVHKRVRNVEMEILGVIPDFNTFKLSDSRRVVYFPSVPQFPHLQSWDSHMLLREF